VAITSSRSAISTASSILCNEKNGTCRDLASEPQLEQLAAQRSGREHVEGGERLVEAQKLRLHRHGAGEADLLAHPARQLARVRGLEAVEADPVEELDSAQGAQLGRHAASLERELHVLLYGQPGKQGERLEDDGSVGVDAGKRGAPVHHLAAARDLKAGDDAQQRAFPAPGRAQQRHELAFPDLQVDGLYRHVHAPARSVLLGDASQLDEGW